MYFIRQIFKQAATKRWTIIASYSTEMSYETQPYELYLLEEGPAKKTTVTREEALRYYTKMRKIRFLEDETRKLYTQKLIAGFCHLYSGQEACAVGADAVMRKGDCLITAYRVHGWTLLFTNDPTAIFCELTGKSCGVSRGKGGSMHMYAENLYGGAAIVGAQVPNGAGVSFALNYLGKNNVCLSLYGEGASNQGQLFETYNMAYLWNIPCLFVCENNHYAMGTSTKRGSATPDFYKKGLYVPGIRVNAMCVISVREATRFAIDYCLKNKRPMILEFLTYRYSGHSMSDPGTSYRNQAEIKAVRETSDPIQGFKKKILEAKVVTDKDIKDIDKSCKKEIQDAVKKALAAKVLPLDELTSDVYVTYNDELRGITPWKPFKHKNTSPFKKK